MVWLSLILLWLAPFSAMAKEYELAACAIFQNEDRFLDEWISYHKSHGVEHFWLYNNNSTDNYLEVLQPYLKTGLVELIDWPSSPVTNEWENFSFNVQVKAYTDAIHRAKNKTKWLAIIDTDEFIVPIQVDHHKKTLSIRAILKNHHNDSAIALQWACFGTSGIDYVEPGKMLQSLVLRLPLDHPRNGWSKTIVKPLYIESCENPHFCNLREGKCVVLSHEEARLNHYWARDELFLHSVKVPRYVKWGGKEEDILNDAAQMNQVYDDSIKWGPY